MTVLLSELLQRADENHFAVPQFNFSDIWELEAIIEAAEQARSPVIVATISKVVKEHGLPLLSAMGRQKMADATVPVVLHLDHCTDPQGCIDAVDCGYPSVMFDGSALELEENISHVQAIVAHAAPKGVCVEAEIGRIKGISEEGVYEGGAFLAEVWQAEEMIRRANITSLAVGIGNAHGLFSGKVELNYERLSEINEAVSIPLVLHGGSGLPRADVQEAIRCGINKVNVGTQLHHTYLLALEDELKKNPQRTNIIDMLHTVKEAVKKPVLEWIETCMSAGRV